MFTGLPCWSSDLSSRSGYTHTLQRSPGCHCPVTSNQQHEPLLTFSLAMSTIFFTHEHAPLAMPKASYPSMESILIPILGYVKTSFSACTLTELTAVHFFHGIKLLYYSQECSFASQSLSLKTQTAS